MVMALAALAGVAVPEVVSLSKASFPLKMKFPLREKFPLPLEVVLDKQVATIKVAPTAAQ